MGKRVGYNDEVTPGMASDAKENGHLDVTAKERFATGKNKVSRYTTSKKPPSARGNKNMPS